MTYIERIQQFTFVNPGKLEANGGDEQGQEIDYEQSITNTPNGDKPFIHEGNHKPKSMQDVRPEPRVHFGNIQFCTERLWSEAFLCFFHEVDRTWFVSP